MSDVVVPVKTAWWSKVNWIQLVGVLLSTAVAEVSAGIFGFDDATKVQVLFTLNLIQGISTIIIKTWFTPGVIVNSLSKTEQARLE